MSNPKKIHETREGWLMAAAQELHAEFLRPQGLRFTSKVRVSCGFPSVRARSHGGRIGECWSSSASADGTREIMIHPKLAHSLDASVFGKNGDGFGVLPTLLHELIHASMDPGVGHKAPFAKAAKAAGLEGKPTQTYATGEKIRERLEKIATKLGEYPHASLDASGGKKQTTRLLKVVCPDCGYVDEKGNGYTIRVTQKWIDVGTPICPCGTQMIAVDGDEEVVMLKAVESSATYSVPNMDEDGNPKPGLNERFQIRRMSGPTGERWTVIDFGEKTFERDGQKVAHLGDQPPRLVLAESRQDALDMIAAIDHGLYTWDHLEAQPEDDQDAWDGELDPSELLDYTDAFAEEDKWEDAETPDHPEDQEPDEWVHPRTGKVVKFNYDEVAASRES